MLCVQRNNIRQTENILILNGATYRRRRERRENLLRLSGLPFLLPVSHELRNRSDTLTYMMETRLQMYMGVFFFTLFVCLILLKLKICSATECTVLKPK